jgi:chromosome transmission fidelity protein 4
MYDSAGILSVLDRFRRPMQGRWVPILDTNTLARRQGKDESYWPIGLSGKLFMCLILKGREEYPAWPRPLVQELEVQLPMLNLHEPQGLEEERYARDLILLGWNKDALVDTVLTTDEIAKGELSLDKGLVKLMQIAIKADQLQRAHDIVRLMHHSTSLDMALKMAQFYHLLGLEEKIKEWKRVVQDRERLEEERDARREWRTIGRPVGMGEELVSAQFGLASGHPDGFDTAAFPRKSLGSAKPLTGATAFSKKSSKTDKFTLSGTTAHGDDIYDYDGGSPSVDGAIDVDMSADLTPAPVPRKSPPNSDGKRKREQEDAMDVDVGISAKKAKLEAPAKPVPTTNPFAKKAPAAVPAAAKPNPFARNGSGAKSMMKSTSFFEKVDAAEGYLGPGGDKKSEPYSSLSSARTVLNRTIYRGCSACQRRKHR